MQNHSTIKTIFLHNFIISIIFFLIVISGIFWGKPSYEARDQNIAHLPQIQTFVEKPFTIGSSYPATIPMTPGQHVVLSWVSKYWTNGTVGADVFPIRLVNATFGLGLLLACWWLIYLSTTGRVLESTYLVFPLLFSPYVLGTSIWIMTDNGALLWACITLIILSQENRSGWFLSLAGIFSALAVFWRQTYIFLIVPMLWRVLQEFLRKRNWQLLLVSILIPLATVIYFITIWKGFIPPGLLLPPEFVDSPLKKLNFSILTYIIALFGTYGIFYIGYLSSELINIFQRKEILTLVFVLLIGVLISLLFPLGMYSRTDGILLKLASKFPVFYGRSILVTLLASLGAGIIYLWLKTFHRREGQSIVLSGESIIFVNTLSWIAVFIIANHGYQRYFDSWIIISLSFLASRKTSQNRHSYLGVLILSGLFLILSLAKFSGIAAKVI